jgi:hypothetical protein
MDRYPGTDNPISFASEVQLIDQRKNLNENYRIYMNHVLDYEGYRFFQSSYDNDEKGTYLSVNHDFWGTWISYTGYFLLTVGMVLSLLSRKSRFQRVSELIREIRKENKAALRVILLVALMVPSLVSAQKVIDPVTSRNTIDATHAEMFSRLVVQDQNGRMKPIHTLSREILRKLARTESMYGLNADQIVLGMFANSRDWINVPMIKVGSNEAILKLLGVSGEMAAYTDFFNDEGKYRLQSEILKANGMQPRDRGVFEKELIKIDERVNIANMIFSGHIFKIIPVPDDPNNTWESGHLTEHTHSHSNQSVAERFFDAYRSSLREAMDSRDFSIPNSLVNELAVYQKQKGSSVMPSASRINTEIVLNKLDIFNRLSIVYTLLGLSFLFLLFVSVFKPGKDLKTMHKILFGLVVAGFAFHTVGLGMRWYVSGRAPWSNGYESMIYIGWTTVLAGIFFTRKSFGGLAATMVLAATVLSVAHLSYLDPEITPLVPVLRSYWLTIHVSMEAGSYGFLMLGAIIGLINLILMIFLKKKNEAAIHRRVREMAYLSE